MLNPSRVLDWTMALVLSLDNDDNNLPTPTPQRLRT